MSNFYYGTTTGGQRQRLPSAYGSRAPYAASYSYPKPPSFPSTPIYRDPVVSNPADTSLGQPTNPGYSGTPPYAGATGGYSPGPAAAPPAAPPGLDYSNDPILGRIRALAEESISQAQADATAARTRLVIGLGDPDLAAKLNLGSKVRGQAEQNPFGTFQELGRQLQRRNVFDINRPLSDRANLFYSTERGRQLALSGEQHLRERSQATGAAQSQLADISARLTQARMAAQAQIIQAEQEAYQRALQQALYGAGG